MNYLTKSLIASRKGIDSLRVFFTNFDVFTQKTEFVPAEVAEPATVIPPQETGSSYSADKPIESVAEDRFNRAAFAKRIADTLATRVDSSSVVVGVYGPWGDGKTSVLRLMEITLAEHGNIIPVRFNPWYFSSQEQLLQGFFKTLAEAAGKSLIHKKEQFGKLLEEYGGLLSVASLTLTGGIVSISSVGEAAQGIGKALSTVELDKLRERLESILEESHKRIVIMIDDIDRLDQDEIHAVFKLVKLSAGFKHTSYVLALDDNMVSSALGKRYGGGSDTAGRNFLEKIVQVPLHVPAADEIALRKLTLEGIDAALKLSEIELSQEQVDVFVRHFVDGIEDRLITPRQSKLYANALTFALPILKGEVNVVDQMLIEGIRIFYPKLYCIIRENPEFFLEEHSSGNRYNVDTESKRITTLIDVALKESSVANIERIKEKLLKPLFPRAFGNASYGGDWEKTWAKEQRICSAEYFKRYFQYSVPAGDIPDLEAESFLRGISEKNDSEIDMILKGFSARNGLAALVKKLRAREFVIESSNAAKLALALARLGDLVPRQSQMFISDWDFTQTAILISELVKTIAPGSDRDALAKEVVKEADYLPFAFECFRWLRYHKDEDESARVVSSEIEQQLGELLAERIKLAAKEVALYKKFGSDSGRLFWAWNKYGKHEEVEAYLKEKFESEPEDLYLFLDSFVGKSWGLESGLSSRSEFQRESYDLVATYIDPNYIMLKLEIKFGEELKSPNFYQSKDTPIPTQLAHQFTICHQKAQSEKTPVVLAVEGGKG